MKSPSVRHPSSRCHRPHEARDAFAEAGLGDEVAGKILRPFLVSSEIVAMQTARAEVSPDMFTIRDGRGGCKRAIRVMAFMRDLWRFCQSVWPSFRSRQSTTNCSLSAGFSPRPNPPPDRRGHRAGGCRAAGHSYLRPERMSRRARLFPVRWRREKDFVAPHDRGARTPARDFDLPADVLVLAPFGRWVSLGRSLPRGSCH